MRFATVVKKSVFDAAHRNTGFGEGHPCANIHGHTFHYEVHVKSPVDEATGLSLDFAVLKKAMKRRVDELLDHKYLNEDVEYFRKNAPSGENLAYFIFNEVQDELTEQFLAGDIKNKPEVTKVVLHETPTSYVVVTNERG